MHKMKLRFLLAALVASSSFAKDTNYPGLYGDSYIMETKTSDVNESYYQSIGEKELSKLKDIEVKYRFGFYVPAIKFDNNTALMASYSQTSLWQLANKEQSSPFRETNYNPQLFLMHQGRYLVFDTLEAGYWHQSNGRGGKLSRSWERGYIALENYSSYLDYGVKGWIKYAAKENKDIADYVPPYSIWFKVRNKYGAFSVEGAQNFSTDRGHVQASYDYYLTKFLTFKIQVWNGYGETLVDYNHHQTRYGIGIGLNPEGFSL